MVGHLSLYFFVGRESTNLRSQQNIFYYIRYMAYNSKSTNWSVHKHVHRGRTTNICAHKIKWFQSKSIIKRSACESAHLGILMPLYSRSSLHLGVNSKVYIKTIPNACHYDN